MQVIDYIRKCVKWYVEMTPGQENNLRVFVDCTKNLGYSFIQINGLVFIPNGKDLPFNGFVMRSSDVVDGWEAFEEIGIEIPHVKEIEVRRKLQSGDDLIPDKIPE